MGISGQLTANATQEITAYARARMNPLTAVNVTGTTSIAGYTAERMLWNEITHPDSTGRISFDAATGAINVKANTVVRIKSQLNRVYSSNVYTPTIKDVTGGGAGTTLKAVSDTGGGVVGDNLLSNSHRQTNIEWVVAPTVDSKYVLELAGGWNSLTSYWNATVFPTVGVATLQDWNWIEIQQIGTTAISNIVTVAATIGDAKSGFQSSDHGGWIKLDGRAKSTLTTTQQAAANTLGYGVNIPDATGRVLVQGALGAQIGSSTIAQNQLPNVSPSVTDPGHTHTINGQGPSGVWAFQGGNNFSGLGGNSYPLNGGYPLSNTSSTSGITVGSINGGVTQQSYIPAAIGVNHFVYLGN
jgi:hypothetical protein